MADPDAGGPHPGSRRAVLLALALALAAHVWFIVAVSLSRNPF